MADCNPSKTPLNGSSKDMLDNRQRLELVYRACEPYPKLKPSDIEFVSSHSQLILLIRWCD